eukprot:TRINITY_DN89921_c0_g1_i1.p1 TRINITY_DN89921_c0_g1~~TRINITY_DN89921_c0_g1_i1.p1  ORF type:complete len:560 (+),score=54.51 TRINITY_DN89921_c0_g1_i1:153-1832(+)
MKTDLESISLSEFESSPLIQYQQGVTTITFFRGQLQPAVRFLRDRLCAIVSANPWIVGRCLRDKRSKHVQCVYPSGPIPESTRKDLLRVNPRNLSLSSKMSYADMVSEVISSQALLPRANSLLGKSDLVARVTLVSDPADTNAFAMVFSMSHAIADGYTYFNIMKMLSCGSKIITLSQRRRPEVAARCDAAAKEDMAFVNSYTWMCGAASKLLLKPKNRYYAYLVDTGKIKEAKEQALQRGAEFVSTNDILVSTFGNMIKARCMFLGINFRNRVDGASDEDAGNYQGTLWLDEGVYKHPEGIREVLQAGPPFRGRTQPFPGFFETAFSEMGGLSNWAFLRDGLNIPECEQLLQLPVFDFRTVPIDMAIVFAPRAGELAVIYGLKYVEDDASLRRQAPLGAKVADTLFPCSLASVHNSTSRRARVTSLGQNSTSSSTLCGTAVRQVDAAARLRSSYCMRRTARSLSTGSLTSKAEYCAADIHTEANARARRPESTRGLCLTLVAMLSSTFASRQAKNPLRPLLPQLLGLELVRRVKSVRVHVLSCPSLSAIHQRAGYIAL